MTAPQEWEAPDLVAILEASDGGSVDSVDHVDSDPVLDSDEEAHVPPPEATTD